MYFSQFPPSLSPCDSPLLPLHFRYVIPAPCHVTEISMSWTAVALVAIFESQLCSRCGPLPHSQVLATCPCPEPHQSHPSPLPPPHPSWRSLLIFFPHICLGLPSGLIPSGLPTKTLYAGILSTVFAPCPAHLILPDMIFGEEYRSLSS